MRTAAAWSFPCGGCFCPAGRKATGLYELALADFWSSATPGWRGAVFARRWTQQRRAMLFESTRLCESDICAKENRQCISAPAVFSWARVDYASRASKKAPQGPFCRRDVWRRPMLFESTLESETSVFYKTKSPAYFHTLSIFGGRGWIRTTEAEKQQIYSLSPLATREHAHILFVSVAGRLA